MSPECIALANHQRDCELIKGHYANSAAVRLQLKNAQEVGSSLPIGLKRWLDGGVDALHRQGNLKGAWKAHLASFAQGETLLKEGLSGSCSTSSVKAFAYSVLTECSKHNPDWISIPQVPVGLRSDRVRNGLNKKLALATEQWRTESRFTGKLVLPVILFRRNVFNAKTKWRNQKLNEIKRRLNNCTVDRIWVVNTDLDDEEGSTPNEQKRFPGLVTFHQELKEQVAEDLPVVAGPYWAMNIVLWARGLVSNPVIGVATGFRYYIPGGPLRRSSDRIAIPPLYRRATRVPGMFDWLREGGNKLEKLADSVTSVRGVESWFSRAAGELSTLAKQYGQLVGDPADAQVARFYKAWLDSVEKAPKGIRALSLHQDLSSAHVVGKVLGSLPEGNRVRQSGRLARQYMLNCL